MSKAGTGTVLLLLSGVVCKILGALFRLPLTNMLGIEGIGIFQLIMALYAFALVVCCGGVTTSLSKLISSARAKGQTEKISIYLKRSVLISVGIALALGVVFFVFGNYIAGLQKIASNKSYLLFVVMLPLGAGLAVFRGFFQGYQNMTPTAISQVIEQVFKFVLGLLFAFWFGRFGVAEGVFGAFLGITLSEGLALVVLFFMFQVFNKKTNYVKQVSQLKFVRKEFDRANSLLTLSASVLPLVNAFDGLIIVPRLMSAGYSNAMATKLFGLQAGIVGAVLNFPLIISMAVTTALLPNISYLISRGTGGKYIIERGLKMLLFLMLPTTFGMIAISKPLFALVYQGLTGDMLEIAFNLMLYGGFSILFTALMQFFIMLLQANGEFKFILFATIIGGVVKAVLSFCLSSISSINIFSLVLGNIGLTSIVCILALVRLKHRIEFKIKLNEILVLALSTLSMFLVVYTFVECRYFSQTLNLILAVFLGIIVYAVLSLPVLIKIMPSKKASKAKNIV